MIFSQFLHTNHAQRSTPNCLMTVATNTQHNKTPSLKSKTLANSAGSDSNNSRKHEKLAP